MLQTPLSDIYLHPVFFSALSPAIKKPVKFSLI